MNPLLLILLSLASPLMAETLFRQPELTDAKAAAASVIGEVHPGSERFYVRLGNYGKTTPLVLQSWDAGRFTGLQVPLVFSMAFHPPTMPPPCSCMGARSASEWVPIIHGPRSDHCCPSRPPTGGGI